MNLVVPIYFRFLHFFFLFSDVATSGYASWCSCYWLLCFVVVLIHMQTFYLLSTLLFRRCCYDWYYMAKVCAILTSDAHKHKHTHIQHAFCHSQHHIILCTRNHSTAYLHANNKKCENNVRAYRLQMLSISPSSEPNNMNLLSISFILLGYRPQPEFPFELQLLISCFHLFAWY